MASVGTFGALLLHGPTKGTKVTVRSVSLTGAQVNAESGNVTVDSGQTANQLSPLLLPTLRRTINAKGANNDSVTLIGAQMRIVGEELEGANVTMRIDGAGMVASAGLVNSDIGVILLNNDATISVPSNYEVCPRSGFRQSIHKPLVEDAYGEFVRQDSVDPKHPQDTLQSVGNNRQRGPKSSEPDDVFISTDIDPSDF